MRLVPLTSAPLSYGGGAFLLSPQRQNAFIKAAYLDAGTLRMLFSQTWRPAPSPVAGPLLYALSVKLPSSKRRTLNVS